jgi:hypothetical protein
MRLQIVTIADRGIPGQERLHLNVLAPTNLSSYVVLNTMKISPTMVSTAPTHFHWWGSYGVNAGDSVILYTGFGNHVVNVRPDGGKNHFFYWGLPNTIWADRNSCAVVFELANWETSP